MNADPIIINRLGGWYVMRFSETLAGPCNTLGKAELARALYWKRWRWEAEQRLDDIGPDYAGFGGYGHLIDEADDERRLAAQKHREIIQAMWIDWLLRRAKAKGRTLDATLTALAGDSAWTRPVRDPVKLGLIEALQGALFSTREVA